MALNLASDESSMDIPSRELMTARYPEVEDFRAPMNGYETLLNNEKAKRLLGWQPKFKWREQLGK